MASFARVAAEVNESTSPAFLVAFQQHAASQAYFQPLAEHVEVKLKEVRYSRLQKMQTLVALGTSSGRCTRVGAWRASLTRGQINAFLARMTADKLSPLELAHQRLLHDHSRLRTASTVVVDVDETGLCVTGKTSELAAKGYFPRRRALVSTKTQLLWPAPRVRS